MYLKSVEMHGFKSFANKMTLNFGDGITGIVGPNGSGKSNVADAVRWVLGEQSAKQLRGARMEDVIFSGTEVRKPMSFAYVAITLDNSDHMLAIDYDEVTVSRRVYRSGESEYMINGASCRLRDIQELFLDTGIGKEGYSIIGQGQIDKILSGKPEDRRELFDEAAGITKYKKRRDAAVKNLTAEHENLSRIQDIITEIERQLKPLERQSETAKAYLALRDVLRELEISYFVDEYDRSEDILTKVKSDLEISNNQLQENMTAYDQMREDYDRLEAEIASYNCRIDDLTQKIADARIEKEKADGEIRLLTEQISAGIRNQELFQERIDSLEKRIANYRDQQVKNTEDREKTAADLDALAGKQAELETHLAGQNAEADAARTRKEEAGRKIQELGQGSAEDAGRIDFYQSTLEQNQIRAAEINARLLKIKETENEIRGLAAGHQKHLEELRGRFEELKETLADYEHDLSALQNSYQQANRDYNQKQQQYLQAKSNLNAMRNMAERYEGYGNAVKRVMDRKKDDPGIIGVVADVIKVSRKYETAVETALGGSIQNIVVDHEDTAKRNINWLKENRFGRATFLPLNAMVLHNPGNFGGALNEPEIIGTAASLVETEPRFAGMLSHLLGRTLVAENMDAAVRIARKYRYSLRIVTIDGEQLSPGGSISGGAFKNTSNLLGRARELEEYEKTIADLEKEWKDAQKTVSGMMDEINQKTRERVETERNLADLRAGIQGEEAQIDSLNARLAENERSRKELSVDTTAIEKTRTEANEELAKLKQKVAQSESSADDLRSETARIDASLTDAQERISGTEQELAAVRAEIIEKRQNLHFQDETKERLDREIAELEEEIRTLEVDHAGSDEELAERRRRIDEIRAQADSLLKNTAAMQDERDAQIRDRDAVQTSHRAIIEKRESLLSDKAVLEKEIFRLEAQRDRVTEQSESQMQYMMEEYGLSYSESVRLLPQDREKQTAPAMRRKISEQKAQIKALGDVNINAIEDFKELDERYSVLRTQRDDIVNAENTLIGVIEELDQAMRRQFSEQFKRIAEEFNKAFMALFGGGKGQLELVEDVDILEAGIRIIAQPPGKKLQNMMQLSGGEKALTAIALLFAIQNLKPSPFCLLDEIEAALDDSNVGRFADYLHRLTKNTQFIVITHRRGTMNSADVLYGITMQEKGVSTMVSVNLIENELT